jgi:hypothetical protein
MQDTLLSKTGPEKCSNDVSIRQIGIALFLIMNLSCKERTSSQNATLKKGAINNCYTLRPVYNDSQLDGPNDFEFTHDSINSILQGAISDAMRVKIDSSMNFVTGFGHQKKISINADCFGKLSSPDSSFLIGIYYNSSTAIRPIISSVEFLQSYKKDIFNFGQAIIYEYRFNNVVEASPHFMYIIVKDESRKHDWDDYKGFVICSDGMDWKDYNDKGFSIPLFTQMVRRSKEFYIPLYYDGRRFIPIDHFKSSNWQE